MNKLSNRPQNKNFGSRAGRAAGIAKGKTCKIKYYKSPKKCKHCESIISYEKRRNKFCTSSCSAKYNNPQNRKFLTPVGVRPFCAVSFNQCVTCNKFYRIIGSSNPIYCSPMCNPDFPTKKAYRKLCKFNISPKEYPELYNSKLIQKYGWYLPTNQPKPQNLKGVCWDHLYRIEDGYKNKIDPTIISHPANAELVPWTVNIGRKKSTITFKQLQERIQLWNRGIHDLPTFYIEK